MTNKRDEILEASRDAHAAESQASYESTVARRILTKLAPGLAIGPLVIGNNGRLTLDLARRTLPAFPLRLTARNVGYLPAVTVQDLFNSFMKTPIFKALTDHADARGWTTDDRIGLVTGWSGMPTMVLHNLPRVEERLERHKGYARMTFVTSRGVSPEVYSLEPLDSLLEAIKETL